METGREDGALFCFVILLFLFFFAFFFFFEEEDPCLVREERPEEGLEEEGLARGVSILDSFFTRTLLEPEERGLEVAAGRAGGEGERRSFLIFIVRKRKKKKKKKKFKFFDADAH